MHLSEKFTVTGKYIKTNPTYPFKQGFNASYSVAILWGVTLKKIYCFIAFYFISNVDFSKSWKRLDQSSGKTILCLYEFSYIKPYGQLLFQVEYWGNMYLKLPHPHKYANPQMRF